MKPHDQTFYEQLDYVMQMYREGHVKTVPELMKFIEMIYGDYIEFHPDELPEIRYGRKHDQLNSIREEGKGDQ